MTIHRFLIENAAIDLPGGTIKIVDGKQIKQISRVLRLGPEDCIDVVDEAGKVYHLRLLRLSPDAIEGSILSTTEPREAKPFKLTVVLALLKGGNFESALTKLTEIGVDEIIPVVTDRTVVKPDFVETQSSSKKSRADLENRTTATADKTDNKSRRWMSIVKEAVEQCERFRAPKLFNVQSLEKALNDLTSTDNPPTIFICAERSQAPHLVTIVYSRYTDRASPAVSTSDICIVIGPEGGFTDQEIDHAISLGCLPCRLGDNILRSETAAVVSAALVASFGEFLCENQKYQHDA